MPGSSLRAAELRCAQCQSDNEAAAQARAQAEPGGAHGAGQCCSAAFQGHHSVSDLPFHSPDGHLFLKHLPPPGRGQDDGKTWSLPCVAQSAKEG